MQISNVKVTIAYGEMARHEIEACIEYIRQRHRRKLLQTLELFIRADYVNLRYKFASIPFECVRRMHGNAFRAASAKGIAQ